MTSRWTTPLSALAVAAVAVGGFFLGGPASAHGNPEIVVTPNPAPGGTLITIEGEEFEENVEVSLSLEGVSGSIALGMAMTDAEGRFHQEVALPNSATPGSYQLRAEGGDDSAVVEFRISAGAGAEQPVAEHETSIGFHRGGPVNEVIGLAALTAVLAVAGAGLLLVRERRAPAGR